MTNFHNIKSNLGERKLENMPKKRKLREIFWPNFVNGVQKKVEEVLLKLFFLPATFSCRCNDIIATDISATAVATFLEK